MALLLNCPEEEAASITNVGSKSCGSEGIKKHNNTPTVWHIEKYHSLNFSLNRSVLDVTILNSHNFLSILLMYFLLIGAGHNGGHFFQKYKFCLH